MQNDKHIKEKLAYVCRQFRLQGDLILYRWIPTGHINTAYYAALYDGKEVRQYLVQKINWFVFREPIPMMHNIDLITKTIMDKEPTLERRRRLHFHHTASGNNYLILREENGEFHNLEDLPEEERTAALTETPWETDWEFWRLYNFIENSVCFQTSEGNEEVLRMSGKAFGKFNRQLEDFDASQLVESIPHFHDTAYRMNTFFHIVEADPAGRVKDAEKEIALIRQYREFAGTLCRQIEAGELPLRVTHNDTKTNNILFDRDTLDPLVVIDLDTCMPGLACYDFGDTVRFAACTAEEDQPEGMRMDLNLFRAYTEGYLLEMKDVLTGAEIDSLATGAAVITLELASRFLGDYLEGDRYFRIDYPEQNLRRAQAQLVLFQDMMAHMDDMRSIIREAAEKEEENIRIYTGRKK